jgi:hypothetical protein
VDEFHDVGLAQESQAIQGFLRHCTAVYPLAFARASLETPAGQRKDLSGTSCSLQILIPIP